VKYSSVTILDELPNEKGDADGEPESDDPYPLPVFF
jgi:hypothetical protein